MSPTTETASVSSESDNSVSDPISLGKISYCNCLGPGPEVIKIFSCSTQLSIKF